MLTETNTRKLELEPDSICLTFHSHDSTTSLHGSFHQDGTEVTWAIRIPKEQFDAELTRAGYTKSDSQ